MSPPCPAQINAQPRSGARAGLVAGAMAIAAAAGSAPTSAAPEAKAELLLHLDAVPVQLELRGGAGLVLPACRAIEWQRFDTALGRFAPIPQAGCGPLAAAAPVPAEGLRVEAPPQLRPGDTVRAVVVVGEGCAPDRPLPRGACAAIRAIESKPGTIPAPAE